MKIVLISAITVIFTITSLAACQPVPPKGLPPVIAVGCIMPTTGTPALGPNLINAVSLAISEINSFGGIRGSMIALSIEDEGPTAATALLALHKLLDIKKVQVVIGCTTSVAALETGPYAESKQVPIVSPSATSNILSRYGWSRWIFRVSPDDSLQGGVIAKMIKDRGLKKVAVLAQNTVYGRGIAEMAREYLKGRADIIADVSYDAAKLSYMTELNIIKDKRPDCVLHIGHYDDGAVIYRQADELDMGKIPWLAVDGVYDMPLERYLEAARFLEKSVTGTVPVPDLQSDIYRTFKMNYMISYQTEPTVYCDTAYDSMKLIVRALEEAGTYFGSSLRDAIANIGKDYRGASGMVTFDQSGARVVGTYGEWNVQTVGTQYKFMLTGDYVSFLKTH